MTIDRVEVPGGGDLPPARVYSHEEVIRRSPMPERFRARLGQPRVRVRIWFRPNRNDPDRWGDVIYPVSTRMGGGPTRQAIGPDLVAHPGDGPAEIVVYEDELPAIEKQVEHDLEAIENAERMHLAKVKAYVAERHSRSRVVNGEPMSPSKLPDDPMEWPEEYRKTARKYPGSPEAIFRSLYDRDPLPFAKVEVVERGIEPPTDYADLKIQRVAQQMGGVSGEVAAVAKSIVESLIEQGAIHVKRPPGRPRTDGKTPGADEEA